jgi:hypothetical protein
MTMSSKRLEILKKLTAQLQTITPANGYAHDLSAAGRVSRGKLLLGEESTSKAALPQVSIVETPRPSAGVYGAEWDALRLDEWDLLVQGQVRDDLLNPADPAYLFCAEVEACLARISAVRMETGKPLFPNEHMLGGLITGLQLWPPIIRPPEKGVSATAYFYLPLRVGVAGDPGAHWRTL